MQKGVGSISETKPSDIYILPFYLPISFGEHDSLYTLARGRPLLLDGDLDLLAGRFPLTTADSFAGIDTPEASTRGDVVTSFPCPFTGA